MTAQCIDVPTDEVDAFISEKMTDYAGDYVDMQRLFEICDNKPMIERERRAYRNTIDSLRDSLMIEQHYLEGALGATVKNTLINVFKKLFAAGEHHGKLSCLRSMKADGMPAHVAPVHPASESGSPRRILIVDDSKMNIMVLKAQLKNLGKFEVVSAGDGQEALETLRSPGAGRFDLVLTDMWMPRLDGSGLVKAIRADPTLSDMRVVVVTADVEFRAKFAEIGFDSLLLKPITKASLAEALEMEGR